MIVTGHQPNYLPYLGFFHKITLADIFVIVDTVQYVKRGPFGWINRNKIRTHTGWMWLTVPVISRGKYYQKIIDTQIDNSKDWRHQHWRAILLAYERALYFTHYQSFFKDLYEHSWENLADLNEAIIRYIIDQLGIRVEITKASIIGAVPNVTTRSLDPDGKLPRRNVGSNPAVEGATRKGEPRQGREVRPQEATPIGQGRATDLIINICKKLGADTYVHGRHGRDYVDEQEFADNNIRGIWQDFQHPVYHQVYESFIPEMSIIDLLFNHGPESLDILAGRKTIAR